MDSCFKDATAMYFTVILVLSLVSLIGYVGRAQNEFSRFDSNYPLRHLFPFDGTILPKDIIDDGSVQRVVSVLQSNIKQWSFIESQLLEPNVNLGMPEIFIPLRHLTTTLEVLGNILFMRDEFAEAMECLERACPLMELLPASLNEDHRFASSCFALLREVYLKLYGADGYGGDSTAVASGRTHSTGLSRQRRKGRHKQLDAESDTDTYLDDDGVPVDASGSPDDDSDSGADPATSRRSDRRAHSRRGNRRYRRGQGSSEDEGDVDADPDSDASSSDRDEGDSGVDSDLDTDSDDSGGQRFSIERRFAELRSPFDHLRAELLQGGSGHLSLPDLGSMMAGDGSYLGDDGLPVLSSPASSMPPAGLNDRLWAMLRRFVSEDDAGRRELLQMARQYYTELHVMMDDLEPPEQVRFPPPARTWDPAGP